MNAQKTPIVTFYHDVEQDFDSNADPAVCREVVKGFLELEKKYGARATYNVVGRMLAEQPELIEWIRAGGHEVAFHSHAHHRDWSPEHYASEVALCRAASSVPKGYRSPRSQWGEETLAALWENGFLWSAENEPHTTEPYFVHEGLVRLPILTDDWQVFKGRQSFDDWLRQFTQAVDARPYVAIGLHDCVAATDAAVWLAAYERLLRAASERKALLLTFAETADLFRRGAVAKLHSVGAAGRALDDHGRAELQRFLAQAPTADSGQRTVPLELCPFTFQVQRFEAIKNVLRSVKKRLPQPLKRTARALLGKPTRAPH